tara:strand:- start:5391 stop:6071 length:681 start_codon:yes stop_codon:yes gene_type:complete
MELPEVCLFDLDGTLIDSVPDLTEAINRMLAAHGLGSREESRVRNWVGDGSRVLVEKAIADATSESPGNDLIEACYREFHDHYADCCMDRTIIFDHATELLEWLRAKGVRTAIVTNKPDRHAQVLLRHWSSQLPMDVVIGERAGRSRKPDPGMLVEAMKACRADTAWMVGDSEVDSAAAIGAGAGFIGVRLGYNHGRDIADVTPAPMAVFDDLGDLLEWLQDTFQS